MAAPRCQEQQSGPVTVHSTKAMTEDSTPKPPPVSSVGPSMTGLMRSGST